MKQHPGRIKTGQQGWLSANQWLFARRLVQLSILTLFLLGPLAGVWIVKGHLVSSLTLDVLPLTDPYVLLQSFVTGHAAATTAITGAIIVLLFYILIGGRVYCSWVCPVNIVTDAAAWLRRKLRISGSSLRFDSNVRYWIFALSLLLAFTTGKIVWEYINPVSMLYRGLLFGIGSAWAIILAVFLLDLFISRRSWCGHLCPVGAFYSLFGKVSLLRVSASGRGQCNDCMDCFSICPEPQVIKPALKGSQDSSPVILSGNCTNCGRCIDVCSRDVFHFSSRFNPKSNQKAFHQMEVTP